MTEENAPLTSIVISPHADRNGELSSNLSTLGRVRVLQSLRQYPSEEELARILQVAGPAIVFLGVEDVPRSLALAAAIDRSGTGTQVVVLADACDPRVLVASMQAGVREFLPLPLDADQVNETVYRITEVLGRKPLTFQSTDAVYSFLPAKPGDGASTVALNVSAAIARLGPGKTLLADFDLHQGVVSFLLKITNGHSVIDAINVADRLDDTLWRNLVLMRDSLDVLCSGRLEPASEADLLQSENILRFARRSYNNILLDLSGAMEPFSMPLLSQSREVFLVCTPEIASLHFARSKAQFLREAGFGDRASVIINRSGMLSPFSTRDLESLLGLRIRFSFPNDPRQVSAAMRAGTPVDAKSSLGRQFEMFAKSMTGDGKAPVTRRRRFIEYFAIVPPFNEAERVK